MKKTALLILAIFLIMGCSESGSGSKAPIASVDLSGANGYLRTWNSPPVLNKILDTGIATVTWTDTEGIDVTVNVSESKLLASDYMVVEYEYDNQTKTAIADIATGELMDIVAPENWDEIEYRGSDMYYVGGGSIRKINTTDGSEELLSGSDSVPGSSTLTLGDSLIPFALSSSFKHSYPSSGSRDISGSPSAVRLYDGLSAAESGGLKSHSLIYDNSTDVYYMIHWEGDSYWQQNLNDDGSVTDGAAVSLSHPFSGGARRVGSGEPTPENSVFDDGYSVMTVSISGGSISLNSAYTATNSGTSVSESKYVDGKYYYQSNSIDNTKFQIRESDLLSTDRVLQTIGIYDLVEWDVVGGKLFWIDNTGSWVMDLATETVEAYQASAVEAVTE